MSRFESKAMSGHGESGTVQVDGEMVKRGWGGRESICKQRLAKRRKERPPKTLLGGKSPIFWDNLYPIWKVLRRSSDLILYSV